MKLDFRIDWGYQYLYSRRHYHPFYRWDGTLECENGTIEQTFQLAYPVIWYGPGQCAIETELPSPEWESTTRRGFAGVRFVAEVNENTVFHLKTLSGNFSFTAREIIKTGRKEFSVGPKYLNCHVIVTRSGFYWFRPEPEAGQQILEADDFSAVVPVRNWARMRTAWIAPGKRLPFEFEVKPSPGDVVEQLLHIQCMAAPDYTPGAEKPAWDYFPIRLYCDGKLLIENTRFYRKHDAVMQLLEDLWLRFTVTPGVHRFELENGHPHFNFLIDRITLQNCPHFHGELSLPEWALCGEKLFGRIYAAHEDKFGIQWENNSTVLNAVPGWNEFYFTLNTPGINIPVSANGKTAYVKEVYDLPDETPEVTVGFDMTTVPHDRSGTMEWILDYTARTRLGNLVVFRSFLYNRDTSGQEVVDDDLLLKWAEFCRDHHIYVEAATDFDSGALVKGAKDMLHSVGRHEWPGAVYAFDPAPEWRSEDMKSAMEHYLARLKIEVDRAHRVAPRAAFGDASGGHRYCYMAGADFIRSETMVPHTQHLCSQARPAAEVFRNGEWGVHIAIQHSVQPYFDNHLGMYFLSLFQPWMMGANMIYEEDSLFNLFKEERQSWDDRHTKGKRDMTREFYKFVKTHPRKGQVVRKIAFVEGRYAAPFNGFICDSNQTPDYSVWGLFGNNAPEWGHRQPEKCRQLLDVLMPGASTLPLRQDFTKRRFYFSGTPYGDFDEVPTEASAEYIKQYSLLLHLGWNTMIAEDHAKLEEFVRNGGTLLVGIAQFSTHVRREFLNDMSDLALWNGGDLSALCGIKVNAAGKEFSGIWNCSDREKFPGITLSAQPSRSSDEDGACRLADITLAGAEPFIWDADSNLPLVTRFQCGKGTVYTLTAYAYAGHEKLQKVMASLIAHLAQQNLPECFVSDPSGEVFWNMHKESGDIRRLMLLNTDWSAENNSKQVTITTPEFSFETTVTERKPLIFTIINDKVVEVDSDFHVDITSNDTLTVYGTGKGILTIRTPETVQNIPFDTGSSTSVQLKIPFPQGIQK